MNDRHFRRAQHDRAVLAAVYPKLFDLENPVPLAIGIHKDIRREFPDLGWLRVCLLLTWLTKRRQYLMACVPGAERHGLKGPQGVVTEAGAQFAAECFQKRNDKSRATERWVLNTEGRWQPPTIQVAA